MTDKTKHKSVSRRSVLRAVGGLGVAASAGALAPRLFTPAVAGPAPKVRLAWTEVAACHSPLGFGVAKGIYNKHNLDVELFYQGASGQTLIQALATGKADAGAGLIGDWLKPLEQGFGQAFGPGFEQLQHLGAGAGLHGQVPRGRLDQHVQQPIHPVRLTIGEAA